MTTELFIRICVGIIIILGALFDAFAIPYLKELVKNMKHQKFLDYTLKAVEWANQTIPADQWERKKNDVVNRVLSYLDDELNLDVSLEQVDTVIEAFVIEVKNAKDQLVKAEKKAAKKSKE